MIAALDLYKSRIQDTLSQHNAQLAGHGCIGSALEYKGRHLIKCNNAVTSISPTARCTRAAFSGDPDSRCNSSNERLCSAVVSGHSRAVKTCLNLLDQPFGFLNHQSFISAGSLILLLGWLDIRRLASTSHPAGWEWDGTDHEQQCPRTTAKAF